MPRYLVESYHRDRYPDKEFDNYDEALDYCLFISGQYIIDQETKKVLWDWNDQPEDFYSDSDQCL